MCAVLTTTAEEKQTMQCHRNAFLEQMGVPISSPKTAQMLRRVIKSIVTYESKS